MHPARAVLSALGATRSLARTGYLTVRGSSDVRRWRDDRQISPLWFSRSIAAAKYIEPGTSVIELGAGLGRFGELLPADCAYQPTDLVQRTPSFLVVDLNTDTPLPSGYDVAVLLGVIEYLHDPGAALARLHEVAPRLILSYCLASPGISRLTRRSRGWVNDLSEDDLTAALLQAGFRRRSQEDLEPAHKPRQVLVTCESVTQAGP